jgi:hypothetical protein
MTMTIIMTPTATTVVVKTTEVNKALSKEMLSSRKMLRILMLAKVSQETEDAQIQSFCFFSLLS